MSMSILTLGLRTTRTVFVGNVHEDIGEAQLRGFMTNSGDVEEARLCDKEAGIWEVVYARERDAKDALLVSGTILKGKTIEVKKHPETVEQEEQAAAIAASNVPAGAPQGQLVLHGPNTGSASPTPMMAATTAVQGVAPKATIMGADGAAAAGLNRDVLEMVKAQPHLATTVLPLLEAHTSEGQAELGFLSMVTDFHKQRAQREAEMKDIEEKMKMQREIERLKAQKEALEEKEKERAATPPPALVRSGGQRGSAVSSDDGSRSRRRRRDSRDARRRRSTSDGRGRDRSRRRDRDRERRGRRRRSTSSSRSSSSSSRSRSRSRRAAKTGSTPPPPPAPGTPPAASTADMDVDTTYVSATPTSHLYIVYPRGTGPPPLQAVRVHFDKLGRLTDLKVSKSLGCIFASLEKCPADVLERLKEVAEFASASVNFAETAYPVYLKRKAEGEKAAAAAAKSPKAGSEEGKGTPEKDKDHDEEEKRREREKEADEREKEEKKKSKWEGMRPANSTEKASKETEKEAGAEDNRKSRGEEHRESGRDRDRRDSGRRDDRDRDRDRDRRDYDRRDYDRRDRGRRDSRERDSGRRDRDYDRRDRRRDSRDRYRRR